MGAEPKQLASPRPQARRNREARRALVSEFGLLTGPQVSTLAKTYEADSAALPSEWCRQDRTFAIEENGHLYFPGFQFDRDGQPRQVIADAVTLLGRGLSPWELALWFTSDNGWLDGRRPADILDSSPPEVLLAARALVDQLPD